MRITESKLRNIIRSVILESIEKRPYNSDNSFAATYGEHKKFLEFSFDQFRELKQYCDEVGIIVIFKVFS